MVPADTRGQDTSNAKQASGETVYVSVSRGQLHSGPSDEFYPTCFVERGASLEVFHRTPDGWLGVRPPAGSFSWVAAKDAYLLPGGRVIEIITDNAVSWIGTELGAAKQFRWQVQLNQGEQLALLGERTQADAEGRDMLWYQIAPPNGEFRWILASAVSEKPVAASSDRQHEKSHQPSAQRKSQPSSQQDGQVRRASPATDPAKSKVVTAAAQQMLPHDDVFNPSSGASGSNYYDGEIIEGEYIEGEYYDDGGYVQGEYIDGKIIDGGYIEGEYIVGDTGPYIDGEVYEGELIYEGGPYPPQQAVSVSKDPFRGWHAMELGDDGLRFTLFERLWGRKPLHDPLDRDPFDLSMPARGPAGPLMPTQTVVTSQAPVVESVRRHRPWRDPRTLRSGRDSSYYSVNSLERDDSQSLLGSSRFAQIQTAINGDAPDSRESNLEDSSARPSALLASSSQSIVTNTKPVNWYGVLNATSADRGDSTLQHNVGQNSLGLNQLQVALSDIVSQPMAGWQLQPLYEQAQHFVEHGSSAIERGQARLLLERIEEFAALATKNGYATLNASITNQSTVPAVSLAGANSSAVIPSGFQTSGTPGGLGLSAYDATGWLVPVLAATPGQPTHALTDDGGSILAYVTALPGMNLDRYLNQAVGISGLRGYLPQLQAGHIQAQRVVRLQSN